MMNFKNSYRKYVFSLEQINRAAAICPHEFILDVEDNFKFEINNTVNLTLKSKRCKIIMIAGPSSSGKTTTAHMIKNRLRNMGYDSAIISLDDFFLGTDKVPLDKNGKKNFDSIDSIDVKKIRDCISELINEGISQIPIYDFSKMSPKKEFREVKISKDSIVIIEGIHALNPVLIPDIDPDYITKIYIDVKQGIDDYNGQVLSDVDIRFIRRVIRDFKHRSTSVDRTIDMWKSVCENADLYINPYKRMSNFTINTIHPYELCLFTVEGCTLLNEIKMEERYSDYVKHILFGLKKFYPIDIKLVPEDSLLREFF